MRIVNAVALYGVLVEAPEIDPKDPSFLRSSAGVWWQMINGVGESCPQEARDQLEQAFLDAARTCQGPQQPPPEPAPRPSRDLSALSHEAFLQQYVLNRAASVGDSSLRGAGAAAQAQAAWEQIQNQLSRGGE